MNRPKVFVALAFLTSPLVVHATSHPAFLFDCGKYKVTAYKDIPAVTLNGSKMDDYQVKHNNQTPVISFSEYAAAGGSRTNYELWVLSEAGVPALGHQWVNADNRPKHKTQVEFCKPVQETSAEEPGQSMLEMLAEDAAG